MYEIITYKKSINTMESYSGHYSVCGFVCMQMLPLLKRSTDNLVAVIEAKAAAGETFDIFKYVACVCACIRHVSVPAHGNGTISNSDDVNAQFSQSVRNLKFMASFLVIIQDTNYRLRREKIRHIPAAL